MIIELQTAVQVRLPDSPKFATIEAGRKVNYSSTMREGEVWVHRFSVWHPQSGLILQYAETIQGKAGPSWL